MSENSVRDIATVAVSSFDTITATRSLERSGVPRAQDDLAALRAEMKADLAALKAELFRALWVPGVW